MLNKNVLFSFVLCIIGSCYQIEDICNRYLKYTTKTNVKIFLIHKLEMPSLSVCFDLVEDIRKDKLKSKYGRKYQNRNQIEKLIDILTAKEIFDISNINHTILRRNEACGIRMPSSLTMATPFMSREECLKYIRIIKYINRYDICYKFEPISYKGKLEYIDVSYSPSWPGTVLVYYLNQDIVKDFTLYSISVHSRASSDFYDSKLSPVIEINFKVTPRTIVTFSSIALSRLQLPYDTACNFIPGFPSVRE